MKIILSTPQRFHTFSLAEQLHKRGILHKLIAGYFNTKRNAKGFAIDHRKVVRNLIPIVIGHIPNRVPLLKPLDGRAQCLAHELYDLWAASKIEPCDIFVGLSGFSLTSMRKAKAMGARTVVERGSSHMLFQKEILEEEYRRFGIHNTCIYPKVLEKELREYEEADYISIPSNFVKNTFLEKGVPEKKLIRIPYGVSLEHFRPIAKQDNVFRVMHIGGSLRKGTHYLLQAMAELKLPNAELMLIGHPEAPVRDLLNHYGGNINIEQYTGISHWKLQQYYSQSSVYVLPSIEEGLAMVQAEAMACGIPVICSAHTGGEDIIRDGIDGFVVPIRDVRSLKERIVYLYEHESIRLRMGRQASDRVQAFTWDRYGGRVTTAYRTILDQSNM
jgi:glycosyltransferase involved in cell wall biosynthesis